VAYDIFKLFWIGPGITKSIYPKKKATVMMALTVAFENVSSP
jgi:hypothetical protein